jgi:hypothetical protein
MGDKAKTSIVYFSSRRAVNRGSGPKNKAEKAIVLATEHEDLGYSQERDRVETLCWQAQKIPSLTGK